MIERRANINVSHPSGDVLLRSEVGKSLGHVTLFH